MTTAPTPTQLMAGFKSGFGEIIDLVTEANDKTGPWVTDRIKKMSRKAQDEIYGRFNEAFNDGLKDAAAGREFYESSLDFPALAQKTTQVADDIELADQINKLFSKTGQTKTIYEQYKQFSSSAKKEIEKHLGTTAEKAQPQQLQKALITVFGGMGFVDENTSTTKAPNFNTGLIHTPISGYRLDLAKDKEALGEEKLNIFITLLDPTVSRGKSIKAINTFPVQDLAEFRKILLDKHQVHIESATKAQLIDAGKSLIENLVARWKANHSAKAEPAKPVQNVARTKIEEKIITYAAAFMQDCSLLKQSKTCTDKNEILQIYRSLSPYAQLLVEQYLISAYPSTYTANIRAKKDLMEATLQISSFTAVGKQMSQLLQWFDKASREKIIDYITSTSNSIPKIGVLERLLLKEYLDYPRELARTYLASNSGCSIADFEYALLKQIRLCQPPQAFIAFLDLRKELRTNMSSHNKTFAHYKSPELELKKSLLTTYLVGDWRFFSKTDFLNRVIHTLFDT